MEYWLKISGTRVHFPKLLIASLSLLLVGCFPAPETFFEPSAGSGKVIGHDCHGAVGPPDTIRFEKDGVTVYVYTALAQEAASTATLTIFLQLPRDAFVSFQGNDFIYSSTGEDKTLFPEIVEGFTSHPYTKNNIKRIHDWQVLHGEGLYYMRFILPANEVHTFSFRIPSLLINKQRLDIPTIDFSLNKGWYIYPINC